MKAYRVNLMGTNDHYLITEKQKSRLDQMLEGKTSSIVTIGGDTIRISTIKSITKTNVDPNSCPDYFQQIIDKELDKQKEITPTYRKLPTEWVFLSDKFKIICPDVSSKSENYIVNVLGKDSTRSFYMAQCHYRIGENGEKEYLTQLEQIPQALQKAPDLEYPDNSPIVQIYRYGEPQIDPITGRIKGR